MLRRSLRKPAEKCKDRHVGFDMHRVAQASQIVRGMGFFVMREQRSAFSIEFDGWVPCELTSALLQPSGKKEWRNVEGCGLFWSMGFLSQLPRRAKHRPSERALTGTARLTRRLMRARSL